VPPKPNELTPAHQELHRIDRAAHLGVGQQIENEIGARGRRGEDADQPGEGRRITTGALQRLPGTFEKLALLGIEDLGLARGEAEEAGVEAAGRVERGHRGHERGIGPQGGIGRVEEADGFHPVAEVPPEPREVRRAGKAPGHADDGDLGAVQLPDLRHSRHPPDPSDGEKAPAFHPVSAQRLQLRSCLTKGRSRAGAASRHRLS
jgi:hypothetical protein